ncbi:DsbA family protein [Frankia sp. AiPs1]|uniref:DsbA family oxidoreductase n=1 Tax=Frankia sp. AiPs1 TaxID=573493 RepID=UPI00204318C3|nr:DsbA family protein [Frankia sp. AiPs1]MCM3920403.1 DsbA family protein [Frankia sp. AiPs1]
MSTVRVDMWTDLGCPWGYVGRRRLELGFEQANLDATLDLRLHAFELDPGTRTTPISIPQIFVKKHGGTIEDAIAAESRVASLAKEVGLPFTIDRLAANTHDVLRVLQLATNQGLAASWFAQLQRGYFGATINPFDPAELTRSAVAGGMDADEVSDVLAGTRFSAEVARDRDDALDRGATGVPYLVIDNRVALSGIATVTDYARAFTALTARV